MPFHEPDLKKVLADEILSFQLQDFVHESDLVIDRFLLKKDESKFTSLTKRGEGGLVEIAFLGAHPTEHVYDDGGIDDLVNKVSFHRDWYGGRIAWRREGMQARKRDRGSQCCLAQHTFFQRFLEFVPLDSRHERFRNS